MRASSVAVQRPQRLMKREPEPAHQDRHRLLDLAQVRLLVRTPGQHEVLQRSPGARAAGERGDHLRGLNRPDRRDEVAPAERHEVTPPGLETDAVDVAEQVLDLPGDRRAIPAHRHPLADHRAGPMRCPTKWAIASPIKARMRRASCAKPGLCIATFSRPPSRRS